MLKKYKKRIRSEFSNSPKFYLSFILIFIFYIGSRIWRIDQLLEFNYDQGRDALAISSLLNGNLILLGPTTGIEGIFLGPFYYYFLAIGYFLGQGSPVIASIWQTIFVSLGFVISFYLLKKYISKFAAITYALLSTFSFYWIKDNRWLSNPTPSAFFVPLTILFLIKSFISPLIFLPMTFLSLGILLQLEAATGLFIFLTLIIFIIFNYKKYNFKSFLISALSFFITLIPQIIFELKYNFLITKNIISFITSKASTNTTSTFQIPSEKIIMERIELYSNLFFNTLKVDFDSRYNFLFVIFLLICIFILYKNWQNVFIKITSFIFLGVLFILLFYQGNYGQIYFWYFIPLIQPFFLLLATALSYLYFKNKLIKPVIILFVVLVVINQLELIKNYLNDGLDGPTTVALGNQVKAVKYVIEDSKGQAYNTDVYLPPVIPYPYTYLFNYYGKKYNQLPSQKLVSNLYTLHEVDTAMPKREISWLKRQEGIGKIVKQVKFGGISVEKRERLKNE